MFKIDKISNLIWLTKDPINDNALFGCLRTQLDFWKV
jgi:hypothetical protein